MSERKVKLLLFLTILVVSVLPLLAALYLLDRSLQTSLKLGFNPQVAAAARLPQVQPARVELVCVLRTQLEAIGAMFPNVAIEFASSCNGPMAADIDTTLFRQVLANIVRNGVEASPGRNVGFQLQLRSGAQVIEIALSNDGPRVPADLAPRMFDPYVSAKKTKDNAGLGLAIARKVIIDHGGDIRYQERSGRPEFLIQLPRCS